MGLDPKAVFVMSDVTREQIAKGFNDFAYGGRAVIQDDDGRLTDARCAAVARKWGDTIGVSMGEDLYADTTAEMFEGFAREFGFPDPSFDGVDVREVDMREVDWIAL